MDSLSGIAFLLGLALLLLGSVMVLVGAFRWRLSWGLFVLFVPVLGLLAFAVAHWPRARNGTLTLILGLLVSLVALWGGADRALGLDWQRLFESPVAEKLPVDTEVVEQTVGKVLERRPGEIEVPNEELARRLGVDTEKSLDEIEAEEEAKPLSIELELEQAARRPREAPGLDLAWQPVSRKRLPDYRGRPVRLHLVNGEREDGWLERLSEEGDSVIIRQRVAGGEVAFEHPFLRIEWIEVLAPRGSVPPPEEDPPAPEELGPRFLPPDESTGDEATGESAGPTPDMTEPAPGASPDASPPAETAGQQEAPAPGETSMPAQEVTP